MTDLSHNIMQNRLLATLVFLFITMMFLQAQDTPGKVPPGYKVVVNESFGSDKVPKTIETAPSGQWLISKGGKPGKTLKYIGNTQNAQIEIIPVVKAFIKETGFKSFVFEADVEQCGRDYNCRDFSIIFNYTDENNYHFIHLASVAGEMCHGVFQMKAGFLTMLTPESDEPVNWGVKQWFRIRVEMGVEAGVLKTYLNGNLVWEVSGLEEKSGLIGFGAPDGSAKIDNLKIWAPETFPVRSLF